MAAGDAHAHPRPADGGSRAARAEEIAASRLPTELKAREAAEEANEPRKRKKRPKASSSTVSSPSMMRRSVDRDPPVESGGGFGEEDHEFEDDADADDGDDDGGDEGDAPAPRNERRGRRSRRGIRRRSRAAPLELEPLRHRSPIVIEVTRKSRTQTVN